MKIMSTFLFSKTNYSQNGYQMSKRVQSETWKTHHLNKVIFFLKQTEQMFTLLFCKIKVDLLTNTTALAGAGWDSQTCSGGSNFGSPYKNSYSERDFPHSYDKQTKLMDRSRLPVGVIICGRCSQCVLK